MKTANANAITSDSPASIQKVPRQPMASDANVPSGMPNSKAAEMPRYTCETARPARCGPTIDLKRAAVQIRETRLPPRVGDFEPKKPAPEIKAGVQIGDIQLRDHGRETPCGQSPFGGSAIAFLLVHLVHPFLGKHVS